MSTDYGPLFAQLPEVDITAGKHGGNSASVAAHERILPYKQHDREAVLKFVRERGYAGATSKQVARHFKVSLNAISGRLAELEHREGLIFDSKRPRVDGCRVLVSERRWISGSAEERN